MKKRITIVLAALFVALCFVGCSIKLPDASKVLPNTTWEADLSAATGLPFKSILVFNADGTGSYDAMGTGSPADMHWTANGATFSYTLDSDQSIIYTGVVITDTTFVVDGLTFVKK